MKRKFLHIIPLTLLMAFSHIAKAQVDFTPVFTQVRLEARADFDYYHNTSDIAVSDNPYGFHGRYFNMVVGGPLGDKFSYYFRQRIIANPGSVSFFDNTDFLYINYMPSKNWMIRMGKDALAVGGFEYDAPPIDVLFNTVYWNNFYCFQPAVAAAYKSSDGKQMVLMQVGNSPYVHYGANLGFTLGDEWKSGLLSFNLFHNGDFGHYKMLNSVNFFQRPDRKFMNYIAIGQKLVYNRWDIYLDLIHHANDINDWGKNFAVVSCANIYLDNGLSFFAKGAWEQNKSNEVLTGFGSIENGFYDCFVEAGTTYLTYGAGLEYRPKVCPEFRFHVFVANRVANRPYTNPEADISSTTYQENSLQFNMGISWEMDIHRMFKNHIAKVMPNHNATIEQ